MRLGYFAMPVHPLNRNYTETLKEDRAAIIFCDELGFYDAFMGEHLSDAAENITSSMLFHATLIHSTFPRGPGRKTRPVSQTRVRSFKFFWLWERASTSPGRREGRT